MYGSCAVRTDNFYGIGLDGTDSPISDLSAFGRYDRFSAIRSKNGAASERTHQHSGEAWQTDKLGACDNRRSYRRRVAVWAEKRSGQDVGNPVIRVIRWRSFWRSDGSGTAWRCHGRRRGRERTNLPPQQD